MPGGGSRPLEQSQRKATALSARRSKGFAIQIPISGLTERSIRRFWKGTPRVEAHLTPDTFAMCQRRRKTTQKQGDEGLNATVAKGAPCLRALGAGRFCCNQKPRPQEILSPQPFSGSGRIVARHQRPLRTPCLITSDRAFLGSARPGRAMAGRRGPLQMQPTFPCGTCVLRRITGERQLGRRGRRCG